MILLAAHSPVPSSAHYESEMIEIDDYRLNELMRTACSVSLGFVNEQFCESIH